MLSEDEVGFPFVPVRSSEQRDHPHSVLAPACIKFVLGEVAYYLSSIGLHRLVKLLGLVGFRCKVSFDTVLITYYVVSCVLAEVCRLYTTFQM